MNKLLSKIGSSIEIISGILMILFIVVVILSITFVGVISPLIISFLNGNIIRALVVISVLGISFYFFFFLVLSIVTLRDSSGGYPILPNTEDKRRRWNVIIVRSILTVISIWCFCAADDLTVLLYKDQKGALLDSILGLSTVDLHYIFSAVFAIFLIFLTLQMSESKPFLKIVRFWKMTHTMKY